MRALPTASAVNDAVFLVVQVAGLFAIHLFGMFSAPIAVACWGSGAFAGAALGFAQFRPTRATLRRGAHMLSSVRGMSTWLVLDYLVNRWARQAVLFVVAGVNGAAVVGGIQASSNLLGATNPLNLGATASALAEGSRQMRSTGESMKRVVHHSSILLAVAVGAIRSRVCPLGGARTNRRLR